jgi:drug/metabolite transporter (DMT)-like permease
LSAVAPSIKLLERRPVVRRDSNRFPRISFFATPIAITIGNSIGEKITVRNNRQIKADLALALTCILWGATFVVVKDAVSRSSVFLFLAVRFSLAAILMAAIQRETLRRLRRKEVFAGAFLGLLMFSGYAFQTSGIVFTTPAKSGFVTGSSVVLVPLLLAIFWRRRLGLWEYLGAGAAFAGLYFLTAPGGRLAELNVGDILTFVAAALYAFHIIFAGQYTRAHSVAALSFLQVAATAILAIGLCGLTAITGLQRPRFEVSWQLAAGILITAVFATAIAFTVQLWAQRYTSASHAAIIFTIEPVAAAITSFLVIGERLRGRALAGAALIAAGILFAELKGPAPAAPESPEPAAGSA